MIDINEITDTFINVHFKGNDIQVEKKAFQVWIDNSDKREWELVYSNESGEPVESTGLMSWDEYYRSIYLNNDLEEFLTVREETCKLRNLYMGKALNKLLTQIKTA